MLTHEYGLDIEELAINYSLLSNVIMEHPSGSAED